VETATRIELPPGVGRPFEIYVNGVPQVEGTDYEVVGATLIFPRVLRREGKLGFWRWARMAIGIAGSYRQNDSIDVIYSHDGQRRLVSLAPPPPDPG
jgi:hypothetical protein